MGSYYNSRLVNFRILKFDFWDHFCPFITKIDYFEVEAQPILTGTYYTPRMANFRVLKFIFWGHPSPFIMKSDYDDIDVKPKVAGSYSSHPCTFIKYDSFDIDMWPRIAISLYFLRLMNCSLLKFPCLCYCGSIISFKPNFNDGRSFDCASSYFNIKEMDEFMVFNCYYSDLEKIYLINLRHQYF